MKFTAKGVEIHHSPACTVKTGEGDLWVKYRFPDSLRKAVNFTLAYYVDISVL